MHPGSSDWIVPDWPAPFRVRAVCTTRTGGVSRGVYRSLNLGDHVGDAAADVAANRLRLHTAIGVRPVFLRQVHGVDVLALDAETSDGAEADACVADAPGIACTIMVADCLPVLFASACGRRVAAAHAGWRGLASGVLESTLKRVRGPGSAPPVVWFGPCIGPRAFEVGNEVKAVFEANAPEAADHFRAVDGSGKWRADLSGLARQRLRAAGVENVHGNDGSDAWCTVRSPLGFFSHRRDGISGRFAACVWIAA